MKNRRDKNSSQNRRDLTIEHNIDLQEKGKRKRNNINGMDPRKRRRKRNRTRKGKIKIAYNNIDNKINKEWPNITNYLKKLNWNILTLTETGWRGIKPKKEIDGYKSYIRNRTRTQKKGGSIVTYIDKRIKSTEWEGLHETDDEWNKVRNERLWVILEDENIAICTIYAATEGKEINHEWNRTLMQMLSAEITYQESQEKDILIMGDFNAHLSEEDGGTKTNDTPNKIITNQNGRIMKSFVEENNLTIWNREKICEGTWTRMRRTEKSIIDYITSSDGIREKMLKIEIDDKRKWSTTSDHNWIITEIKGKIKKIKIMKREKWKKGSKEDWDKYKTQLEHWTQEKDIKENIQEEYKALTKGIEDIALKTIGKSKPYKKHYGEPRNIRRKLKQRKKLDQEWAKAVISNDADKHQKWNELDKIKKEVQNLRIKRQKRINEKKINTILTEGGWRNSRTLWNTIKSFKDRKESIGALKLENENRTTDPNQIKTEIERYLKKLGRENRQENQVENDISSDSDLESEELDIMNTTIEDKEWEKVIKDAKRNKTEGLDEIKMEMIKEAPKQFKNRLKECFNRIRTSGETPQEWNDEKGFMLFKKKDREKLDNYRNISVGSCLGKLFTSIMAKRTRDITEAKKKFNEIQGGFRPKRSTTDNLFVLLHIIEKAKINKEKLYLCFVDLRKAFDSVWREGIWKKLRKIRVDNTTIKLLKNLYENTRKKILLENGYTDWIEYNKGVKQGCTLSPILFNIYLKELADLLQNSRKGYKIANIMISALFFADDMVIITKTKQEMIEQLHMINSYMKKWKLEINFDKTKIMSIGTKKSEWKITDEEKVIEIEEVDEYDYLGLTINKKGKATRKHQLYLREKTNTSIGRTKGLALETINRGKSAETIWLGETKPKMLYACEIIPYNKNTIEQLEKAQNEIGRWILGTNQSTALAGIRGELGWTTVEGEIKRRKVEYWLKIAQMKNDRWPKILLEDMILNNWKSSWYKQVIEAKKWMNIEHSSIYSKNRIRQKWTYTEQKHWTEEKQGKTSLKWYRKDNLTPGVQLKASEKANRLMHKIRTGSMYIGRETTCCEQRATIEHIIIYCKTVENIRSRDIKNIRQDQSKSDIQKMEYISGNLKEENIENIYNIVTEWKQKTNNNQL